MSNVEAEPAVMRYGAPVDDVRPTAVPRVDVLPARDVPLGGPRSMTVRRTLPQRDRTLVGAWCFADHYGPDEVTDRGGLALPPHPHTGLQTVTWLFGGEVEHRDTLGTHALVRPGEINLMTGGYGIAHSEVSTPRTNVVHGVQLWVAPSEEHRNAPRDFQHHAPEPDGIPMSMWRIGLSRTKVQDVWGRRWAGMTPRRPAW
jgi:quercetin 2,3-dioxygenase